MSRNSFRSRFVLGILVVTSLVLVVLDSGEGAEPVTEGARTAGDTVFGPVSSAVSVAARPVEAGYRTLAAAPGAAERIQELEARNKELAAELDSRSLDEGRAEDLEQLLHLSGLGGYEIVPAHAVTKVTSRGYSDAITLDVGERDGVTDGMTVVNGDGLVGRVTRAGTDTATVLPVTDAASAVGVRLEDSRKIGAAEGTMSSLGTAEPLRLELMDADAQVEEGDRVVTLGSHNGVPFVPGVPVGSVTETHRTPGGLSRTGEIAPAVDLGSLDIVGVVVAEPAEDPRDSVLPPRPADERRGRR
ncbi:MAG: rod shape-determining protein MreC [Nocardiopsaceae bacterium]|nr:rod shape-determining protein MreC [Nocardiopsaceae bacterium]